MDALSTLTWSLSILYTCSKIPHVPYICTNIQWKREREKKGSLGTEQIGKAWKANLEGYLTNNTYDDLSLLNISAQVSNGFFKLIRRSLKSAPPGFFLNQKKYPHWIMCLDKQTQCHLWLFKPYHILYQQNILNLPSESRNTGWFWLVRAFSAVTTLVKMTTEITFLIFFLLSNLKHL